jgi:hypothetical protein
VPTQPSTPALAFTTTNNGIVTSVTVTNGGTGYLAPPQINFIGDGAGATAEAVMSSTYPIGHPQAGIGYGSVVGINVTNGGSGYWYLPNAGMGAGLYPNNPSQTGAAVIISTGYVVDLLYR